MNYKINYKDELFFNLTIEKIEKMSTLLSEEIEQKHQ